MTREEEEARAEEREVKRRGALAFHHELPRDACSYEEGDSLSAHWLDGWDTASMRRDRLDMTPGRSAGWRAFQDGLKQYECPSKWKGDQRTEWLRGWEDGERAVERAYGLG